MGGKQFGDPVLDSVQGLVNQIKDSVTAVQASVTQLQNTDVAALSAKVDTIKDADLPAVSTKVDNLSWIGKYKPYLQNDMTFVTPAANTMYDVISIVGAGYLEELNYYTTAGAGFVRVIADGVTVFESKANPASTNLSGIFQADVGAVDLYVRNVRPGPNILLAQGKWNKSYPYINRTDVSSLLLAEPIFFSTTLKVQMETNAANGTVFYAMIGGVR
jgi:hypothetical protein